ncbi:MAG: lipase maturation factor family protein [Chthoniobacterales bacterium]
MPGPTNQVAHPPEKPLMVYDGDCGFCKLWIARWREVTAGAVAYEPLQETAARFPEVPLGDFQQAVKLIETDGRVFSGTEAVYRSLGKTHGRGFWQWCFERVPGFAPVSNRAYAFIAGHRELAHTVTSIFWGEDVRRPTYYRARFWFLRFLGVIYLIAFLSLWLQVDGLMGSGGLMPVGQLLTNAHEQLGGRAYLALPTLCWLDSSNLFLHLLCGAGVVLSLLLLIGLAPAVCLLLLFASYLSLTVVGQTFFSFQWDVLLLEAGFLAIFLAPWRWRISRGQPAPLSRPAIFLLHFLLFKLMLMSGVVKLTSGDASWTSLTALDYHYWTQPLPTVLGWWADKTPEWFKHLSTGFVLVVEVAGAFLLWLPRRLRLLGFATMVLLQLLIGLTGNYAFFNLLTLALCLLLVDDSVWPGKRSLTNSIVVAPGRARGWQFWAAVVVLLVTMPLNAALLFNAFKPNVAWPAPVETAYAAVSPFRLVNGYGLFRVMTKERSEIVVQGSNDAINWKPYEFKWKPGPLDRRPAFVEPHQPRLDWQMWFAALSDVRQNPWFFALAFRLLENSPDVVHLLEKNPFPDKPPRFLRAQIYRYRFSTLDERRATGAWWQREDERTYLPPVSLRRK